jgi:hypothetical protein
VTLPAGARIRATRSFAASQRAVLAFMQAQDPDTAVARYTDLLAELQPVLQRLAWAPASGRPARFLDAASLQGRALAQRAQQLATALGAPHLREAVLKRHLLLYAHGDSEVFLLALKHERQLAYALPAGARP